MFSCSQAGQREEPGQDGVQDGAAARQGDQGGAGPAAPDHGGGDEAQVQGRIHGGGSGAKGPPPGT